MLELFRIRTALLAAIQNLPAVELAEIALGLSCLAIDQDTGEYQLCCGLMYYYDDGREYFGRDDIDDARLLPTDYRELLNYQPGLWGLVSITQTALQQHADFWFPARSAKLA